MAEVNIPAELLEEARQHGLDLDHEMTAFLRERLALARREKWKDDNRSALESMNAWVAEHGLPLAEYRQF